MKIYTIVAGIDGCGKSSLLGILKTETQHIGQVFDENENAVALIEECLEREICFTQETTLSGRKTLDTIKRAIAKDYYIRLYYVGLDTMEESLLRIENRVKRGGHNIHTETVANRFSKRFDDLLAVLPYCNEATFYDNDNGFVTVAKYKNGEMHTIGKTLPAWLKELLDKMA